MDDLDRRIVNTLQGNFPVCERPFGAAAASLGTGEDELISRVDRLLDDGTLTRFGPLFDVERMGVHSCWRRWRCPPSASMKSLPR